MHDSNQAHFQNALMAPDDLPQLEQSSFTGLESDYLYMRLTARGIFFLLIAGVGVLLSLSQGFSLWYWLLPLLFMILWTFSLEILGFNRKGYAIRSKDVSYKTGLLYFRMTSVPFNRIQHCEISQGPLGRLFDLASVKVYTAGGSGSDLMVNGLRKETAQRLRDYITKLSAQYE